MSSRTPRRATTKEARNEYSDSVSFSTPVGLVSGIKMPARAGFGDDDDGAGAYQDCGPKYILQESFSNSILGASGRALYQRSELVEIDIRREFDEGMAEMFEYKMKQAIESKIGMVVIRIDSPGGEVYALKRMLGTVVMAKREGLKVVTIATGKAMSCASILLAMGSKGYRYASEHASILLHEISAGTQGKLYDMETQQAQLLRDNRELFVIIAENAGIEPEYYLNFIKEKHKDLHISPPRALAIKLIDHIGIPSFLREVVVKYSIVPPGRDPTPEELFDLVKSSESSLEALTLDVLAGIPLPKLAESPKTERIDMTPLFPSQTLKGKSKLPSTLQ